MKDREDIIAEIIMKGTNITKTIMIEQTTTGMRAETVVIKKTEIITLA